jgi:hypothetical protein
LGFVNWVENSMLGVWMVDSLWAYPIVLAMHAVGMAIVVGTVIMVDLRLLGYASNASLESLRSMFGVTWLGVALNFLSGVALFASNPEQFVYHPVFWIKIGLMLTGVFSFVYLLKELNRVGTNTGADFESTGKIKTLAVMSLFIWSGVIVAGRLIAYLEF